MTCSQGCDKVPPPGLQGLTNAERRKAEEGTESREPATLARTEGLAETSPTKRRLEVRGGVLPLRKMTTALTISGLPALTL